MANLTPPADVHDQPTIDKSPEGKVPTAVGGRSAATVAKAPIDGLSGRSFGDYEKLEELGRGGMGVVYKAEQKGLKRTVALKMILPGLLSGSEELQRFHIEAAATARLQHPNIVTVYEVGEVDGQHFYSMDFIDGPSLSKRLAQGPMSARLAARYVMIVARAIQHAHDMGILHRDLKPSNILLDADDQPHVTDFGLAKELHGGSTQTRTGTVMGTPSYMSPEQAAGKIKELGPACDVYGLGAILYELMTGRPPFKSETPLDTLMQVVEQEPAPPQLLNAKVERDLETICLKCLEKDPRRRYASADELADDLERYINGETISARSFNMLDRLSRTLGRSHHDVEFRNWGDMLLIFAGIVTGAHLLTFLLMQMGQPVWIDWLVRGIQFTLLGIVFVSYRARHLLPNSTAERQLWSIWLGYIVAYGFTVVLTHRLVAHDLLARGGSGPERWSELLLYPVSAILTGLAFFIMGSSYWGRCYALGLGFMVAALLMPFKLEWSPLIFGMLWGLTLAALGWHLRRLGSSGEEIEMQERATEEAPTL